MRNPYDVLGVPTDATADDIKSAYRRLARRYHPDVNPNDAEAEEKFKEVGAAYSILSDQEKRDRFDRFGTADDVPADPFFGGQAGGFGDLFEMFFGGAVQGSGRRQTGRNGDDLRADIALTLQEVIHGASRDIEVDRYTQCTGCNGLGTEGGKKPDACTVCKGQGVVSAVRNTFIGQVRTSTTCPTCHGQGTVITKACGLCKGAGLTTVHAKVHVSIPPGVEDGSTLHVPGQGHEGTGMGRPGDLYVVMHVRADSRFQRRGQTLVAQLDLTFAQAALGDEVEIEGVDGTYRLEIPAGTQPGTQLPAIKGAGLPPLHGGRRGDLVVIATVKVPEKITDAEAKLLREFAELRGERLPKYPERGGILGNLFGRKK